MEEQSMPKIVVRPRLRFVSDHLVNSSALVFKHWAPLLVIQLLTFVFSGLAILLVALLFFMPIIGKLYGGADFSDIALNMITSVYSLIGVLVGVVVLVLVSSWSTAATVATLGYKESGMAPAGWAIRKGFSLLYPVYTLVGLTSVAIFGSSFLLIFPAIILSVGLSLALYIKVLENVSVLQSVSTSWQITKGYKWSIFGRILLLFIIAVGFAAIYRVMNFIPFGSFLIMPIKFAINLIYTPFVMAFFYYIYEDLRSVRRDVYPFKGGIAVFVIISCVLVVGGIMAFFLAGLSLFAKFL